MNENIATVECLYCNHEIDAHDDICPSIGDDAEWSRLAALHHPDCEWIKTRAHRIDDPEEV